MKKLFLISVVVCIALTSCREYQELPTVVPSNTSQPSSTATLTATKIRPTRTFAPSPTLTPLPDYQTKQVIFDYNVIGDHSVYDFFFDPGTFHSWSRLVLYIDGQLIIAGATYKQKMLSPSEVERLLSTLESLGFYSIESNQKHDPTDKLYNYGNNYQKSFDGREYCISVNSDKSRNLCVYEPDLQYLVPRMESILRFLGDYEPSGMTTYYPDRILFWEQSGRDPYNENLPAEAIPWPNNLPSLETPGPIKYVDGDAAKEMYMFFDDTNAGKVFTQNGKEYTVHIYVVLPHEKLTNAYQ